MRILVRRFGEQRLAALRELIEAVVLAPVAPGTPVALEVRGRLSALIGGEIFPADRLVANDRGSSMVAEEGLEPPTRGL
jgi:site-specific DNA recombinase